MREAEQRGLPYLFKLKITANAKRLIKKVYSKSDWTDAGHGWEGKKEKPRLVSWSRQRNVVIPRRRIKENMVAAKRGKSAQLAISFADIEAEEAS